MVHLDNRKSGAHFSPVVFLLSSAGVIWSFVGTVRSVLINSAEHLFCALVALFLVRLEISKNPGEDGKLRTKDATSWIPSRWSRQVIYRRATIPFFKVRLPAPAQSYNQQDPPGPPASPRQQDLLEPRHNSRRTLRTCLFQFCYFCD